MSDYIPPETSLFHRETYSVIYKSQDQAKIPDFEAKLDDLCSKGQPSYIDTDLIDKMSEYFFTISGLCGTRCNILPYGYISTSWTLPVVVSKVNSLFRHQFIERLDKVDRNISIITLCQDLKKRKANDPTNHFITLDFCIKNGVRRLTFYDSMMPAGSYASSFYMLSKNLRKYMAYGGTFKSSREKEKHEFFGKINNEVTIYQWIVFLELYLDAVSLIPFEKNCNETKKGRFPRTKERTSESIFLPPAIMVPPCRGGTSGIESIWNYETDNGRDSWLVEIRGYSTCQLDTRRPDCGIYSLFMMEILCMGNNSYTEEGLEKKVNLPLSWSTGRFYNPLNMRPFQPHTSPFSEKFNVPGVRYLPDVMTGSWMNSCMPKDSDVEIKNRRFLYRCILESPNFGLFILDSLYHSYTLYKILCPLLGHNHVWKNWNLVDSELADFSSAPRFKCVINCPNEMDSSSVKNIINDILARNGYAEFVEVYSSAEFLTHHGYHVDRYRMCKNRHKERVKSCERCDDRERMKNEDSIRTWSQVNLLVNIAVDINPEQPEEVKLNSMEKGKNYIKKISTIFKQYKQLKAKKMKNAEEKNEDEDEEEEDNEEEEEENIYLNIQPHLHNAQCTVINGYRMKTMSDDAWERDFGHLGREHLKEFPYRMSNWDALPSPWFLQVYSTLPAEQSKFFLPPEDQVTDIHNVGKSTEEENEIKKACLIPPAMYDTYVFPSQAQFMSIGYL